MTGKYLPMKWMKACIIVALALLPSLAFAWNRGVVNVSYAPQGKTVLNLDFGADQYANIAKFMSVNPTSNGNTIANFSADGYPSGVLVGNAALTQTAMPQNYFGHYTMQSTGNSGLNMFFVPPLIVYSGGNSVLSVSPANTGVSGSGGGGIGLLPNGNWNVEFAFGDLVTGVADNGSGFVRLTTSTTGAGVTLGTTTTVQIHNLTGISSTAVFAATKISNNTFDLLTLPYNVGMAVIGGGTGTASEIIMQLSSVTWSWWQSTTGFTNINHTITNWIFCKTPDLTSVQTGNVLSTPAINSVLALSPAWLRTMDMIGVQAVSGQFKYNPPDTAQYYGSVQFFPNYYGGVTAGSGDNYTVAPGPLTPTTGAYAPGELIQFKADRSTTGATPTLAINGRSTGALPLFTDQSSGTLIGLAGQPSSGISISSITGNGTTATVTTTANHGFTTGQLFITNVGGNTPSGFNGNNILATSTGLNTFSYSSGFTVTGAVTGTTNPGQCKITTSANNGFAVGNSIAVGAITGATGCNGTNTVSAIDSPTSFELAGTTFGGTYISGGAAGLASTTSAGTYTPQLADGDIVSTTFSASYFSGSAYTNKYYVTLVSPSYTGTISGTTLTVSAVASGAIHPGQHVTGAGLTNSPTIQPYGTNSSTGTGSTGTYMLDVAPTGTTSVTGTTGKSQSTCTTGSVASISAMSADMSCVLVADVTLLSHGFQFGTAGAGPSMFAPRSNGPISVSVSVNRSGGTAELFTVTQATLISGNTYTAQYRPILGGWYMTGSTAVSGVPMALFKEYARRTGAGIWFNVPFDWSQQSAQDFGTYLAVNFPGQKVAVELENEIWNSGQTPNHVAQGFGVSLGFAAIQDGLYFHSVYDYAAWGYVNILKTIANSYVSAGGTRSNFYLLIQNSGADGSGCRIIDLPCAGGQTGSLPQAWDGADFTPNAITFSGTITPNTNGTGGILTISGGLTPSNTSIYPGFTLSGAGVTVGTKIAGGLPATNFITGNGTYILDTAYGSTVGPVTMTAINTTFAAHGGFAGVPTSTDHNAFPNRPIDYADAVGYATYWTGTIVQNGAGTWNGTQTPYNIFFQASSDYANGVATSNPTLINNGLNVWSSDLTTQTISKSGSYSGNNECGFLSSPQTLGFCGNEASATGFVAPALNSATLNVTSPPTVGTISAGQRISCGGCSGGGIIQPYGTGGTTGTGGVGSYALNNTFNSAGQQITRAEVPTGVVQGWENIIQQYDVPRVNGGLVKLGVLQYEGSIQQNFCSGNPCAVGNISLSSDTPTLAGQYTSNGWSLDPTYGYPGFGTGNTQTASNVISLFLGYLNSTQYYNDTLFFYQSQAAIHAARPYFGPAQYGIEGNLGATATTGAPQWGLYPGDLSTTPLQNYNSQAYFNTH
jgi:hypothetical protein